MEEEKKERKVKFLLLLCDLLSFLCFFLAGLAIGAFSGIAIGYTDAWKQWLPFIQEQLLNLFVG